MSTVWTLWSLKVPCRRLWLVLVTDWVSDCQCQFKLNWHCSCRGPASAGGFVWPGGIVLVTVPCQSLWLVLVVADFEPGQVGRKPESLYLVPAWHSHWHCDSSVTMAPSPPARQGLQVKLRKSPPLSESVGKSRPKAEAISRALCRQAFGQAAGPLGARQSSNMLQSNLFPTCQVYLKLLKPFFLSFSFLHTSKTASVEEQRKWFGWVTIWTIWLHNFVKQSLLLTHTAG